MRSFLQMHLQMSQVLERGLRVNFAMGEQRNLIGAPPPPRDGNDQVNAFSLWRLLLQYVLGSLVPNYTFLLLYKTVLVVY